MSEKSDFKYALYPDSDIPGLNFDKTQYLLDDKKPDYSKIDIHIFDINFNEDLPDIWWYYEDMNGYIYPRPHKGWPLRQSQLRYALQDKAVRKELYNMYGDFLIEEIKQLFTLFFKVVDSFNVMSKKMEPVYTTLNKTMIKSPYPQDLHFIEVNYPQIVDECVDLNQAISDYLQAKKKFFTLHYKLEILKKYNGNEYPNNKSTMGRRIKWLISNEKLKEKYFLTHIPENTYHTRRFIYQLYPVEKELNKKSEKFIKMKYDVYNEDKAALSDKFWINPAFTCIRRFVYRNFNHYMKLDILFRLFNERVYSGDFAMNRAFYKPIVFDALDPKDLYFKKYNCEDRFFYKFYALKDFLKIRERGSCFDKYTSFEKACYIDYDDIVKSKEFEYFESWTEVHFMNAMYMDLEYLEERASVFHKKVTESLNSFFSLCFFNNDPFYFLNFSFVTDLTDYLVRFKPTFTFLAGEPCWQRTYINNMSELYRRHTTFNFSSLNPFSPFNYFLRKRRRF